MKTLAATDAGHATRLFPMVHRIIVGMLACAGFLISLYFSIASQGSASRIERYVPQFCRIDPASCARLLQTAEARLFGIPNSYLGLLFYTALIGSTLLSSLWQQLHFMLFFGSFLAVCAGVYLTYVLLIRMKIRCMLCLASHAINLLIFLVLLTMQ